MNYKFSRPMDYKNLRPGMIVTSRGHLTKSMTKKENDRYLQALTNKAYEALYNCKTIDIQSL